MFSQRIDSLRWQLLNEKSEQQKLFILANLSFAMANTDPDSTIILAKACIERALQLKNDTGVGACENSLGWGYFRSSQADSGKFYLEASRLAYHKLNHKRGEARAMMNLGTVYEAEKNHEKALSYILPASNFFHSIADEKGYGYAEREIGVIYRELGQPEKAKGYLLAAMEIFKRLNERLYTSDALSSLGRVYLDAKLYDSALYFYREALDLNFAETSVAAAYAWDNVGDVYFQLSKARSLSPNIDSALADYVESHDIFKKLNSPSDVAYEDIKVGKCLHALKNYPAAIEKLTSSLNYFSRDKEVEYALEAAQELSATYSSQGNYQLALKYLEESITFKDSVDAANNKELMANMFAKYEAGKKDSTILLLNTQEKLAQQEISRQHIITIFIVSLIILGGFLVFILWNRKSIKQKLKEVEMRNRLSSDLHDDIGSSLSSILLLSNMAAQREGDVRINENLIKKINSNAREVIDRMSDIVWSMNPRYDEGESLRERIENYAAGLKEVTTVAICMNIDGKIDQHHFTMELRKNIFLIIKEAINNALKYACATQISIDFTTSERNFTLSIKDNGKGFDRTVTVAGNGFETMINRARGSNGICEILSAPGNGTVIKAVIPIPHIR
jgi:signal transduction histidine kinase